MTARQRQQRRRRHGRGGGGLGVAATIALVGLLIAGAVGGGWVLSVASSAPTFAELERKNPGSTSVIYASDGSRLGFVQSDELRQPIKFEEMPKDVQNATIAIEDESFRDHSGVDVGAIVRAGIRNVSAGGTVEGGSTITQQLARTLYIEDPERNIERKIREARIALEIEQERSKDWILREYLNAVPYGTVNGRTALGIEAASEVFFGKKASELELSEAALLAGLPQAPSQYNPFQNPRAAIARRGDVLRAMANNDYITEDEADEAQASELEVEANDKFTSKREPYFFDYVQQSLIDTYGVQTLRRGGLKVYTTIDPEMETAGTDAIAGVLNQPGDPSSALVTIDTDNGAIRSMASSGSYDERTFSLAAQGHRQPGSAFKTMVLAAAIREGIDPDSTYYTSRSPIQLDIGEAEPWEVETYSGSSGGNMSVTQATLKSDNSVYAQLIKDIGPEKVKETAELLGITTKLNGYYAEGLGGLELGVSPLEIANAYATLANGGVRHKPHGIERVVFPDGDAEEFGDSGGERVMTDGEAYEVTKILEQNVLSGTGGNADIGCPDGTAGKTGTTDEFKDAWFVGYTPSLATSVWMGYPDDDQLMTSVHGQQVAGGTFPAEIWGNYMAVVAPECETFPTPTESASLESFDGENTIDESDETIETATEADEEKREDAEADSGPDPDQTFYDESRDRDSGGGPPANGPQDNVGPVEGNDFDARGF
ncbi:MAG: transglycosylase domain-containing protein [Thermoleophilaceae bacterium]|nr:transglycosylase domain-containing protein [Thermoleophilaceae bacterium]